jgi:hypothetical protein
MRKLTRHAVVPFVLLLICTFMAPSAQGQGSQQISVPNGHVYWNDGDFITTAFTPSATITANWVTMNCLDDNINDGSAETFEVAITTNSDGTGVLTSAQITNDFRNTGGCDAHKYSFDFDDVTLTGGVTYYLRTKVLAGAEVRTWIGATLYYDGGLPDYDRQSINVPNGQLYWNDGDFVTTAFSVATGGTARFLTMECLDDNVNDPSAETFEVAITTNSDGTGVLTSAQITNNFRNTGGCDEHRYLFDFADVSLTAGVTYYVRTKVLAGAEVRSWGTDRLYYSGPPAPVCTVSPTTLVFGNVEIGDYTDLSFTITNDGGGTLSGTVTETCDHFSIVSGASYSLGAGASQAVTIRFEPTSGGAKACTIDTGTDCADVDGTGYGDEPPAPGFIQIAVPNGHVYWNDGDFITTAFTPVSTMQAEWVTMNCLDDNSNDSGTETFEVAITTASDGTGVLASAQITNNFRNTGGCDAHMYSFDIGDVTLSGGVTYYLRTKVLAGAEVRTWIGATLYHDGGEPDHDRTTIAIPNGHVYWNNGDFITTAFTLPTGGEAHFLTMACLDDNNNDAGPETFEIAITTDSAGNNVLASAQVTNNFRNTGGCDRHLYLFDFPDVVLAGGVTYYVRSKVLAGAEVRTWASDRLYYTEHAPVCEVSPTSLDFEVVEIAEHVDQDFTITNTGTGLLAGSVSTVSPGYSIVSGGGAYSLSAGQSHAVTVRFQPTVKGTHSGHITCGATCPDVTCTGLGKDPAAPGSLNIACPNGHSLTNDGDFAVTLFKVTHGMQAEWLIMNCLDDDNDDAGTETFEVAIATNADGSGVLTSKRLTDDFGNDGVCDGHRYGFDFNDVNLAAGQAYYLVTKVISGAPVRMWAGATLYYDGGLPADTRHAVAVPNGQLYWNDGDFVTTAITPPDDGVAHYVTMTCLDDNNNDPSPETFEVAITTDSGGTNVLTSADITDNFRNTGGCDEHMYLFDFPDVWLTGGMTYYVRTKVVAGAEVRSWGTDLLYFTKEGATALDPLPQVAFRLHPCVPNPFNPSTTIRFTLQEPTAVTLRIFDTGGRLVRILARGLYGAGEFAEIWNGRDEMGRAVGSGVYFAQLEAGLRVATQKMVLLK